jgi:hypothetical protein
MSLVRNVTVTGSETYLVARSLVMSQRYKVSVRAESASGAGPWIVAAAAYLPITMPLASTATLYLDASGLAAGRLQQWSDLSSAANHFRQTTTAKQPTVTIDPATQSTAVVFTGSQHLQSMSMDFDVDLNNAARRAMTVFVVYKPSSSTSPSAIVGKGAAWCVCERAAGATGAAGGRTAHACRSTTRAQVLPRRRLGHVRAGVQSVEQRTVADGRQGARQLGVFSGHRHQQGGLLVAVGGGGGAGSGSRTPLADCFVNAQFHSVGQAIRWSTGTNHPHLNRVTLLSFVFGQVNGSTYDIAAYAGGTQTGFASG